ncbi:MAG TPA: ABC transporter permease [Candidatus Dormibacteraeota bacterium]|nr:ABC transporter permease [Candidatus Dormibacteraeota bacterium]
MATSVETHLPTDAGAATSPERRGGTLRRHANLTRELAISQFKLKYTGSVLGYLWSLFKPLMLFGILYVVFVKLFHIDRGTPNFVFQLLLAIVLFTFFQETTSAAMNSIASNGNMIRKAYFPRSILVVAATLSSLMTFFINLTLIILIAGSLGRLELSWDSLLAPLFVIELYLLVLGISLLLSSLFVFYRDLGHIWEIFMQLLIYASAVIYPISLVPPRLEAWVVANPVAQIIEDMRRALVSSNIKWSVEIMQATYFVPFAIIAILLGLGFYVFNRLTPRFAEYL